MVRKITGKLLMVAAATLVMVGCGSEDITDLSDNWTKKEGEVMEKLTEVKGDMTSLNSRFETMKAANAADTTKMVERNALETSINQSMTMLGDIEKTLNDVKTKRDSAAALGNRAEYEALWNSANAEYEGAIAKLDEIEKTVNDLNNRIDALNAPSKTDTSAAVNGADTTSNDNASMKKDDAKVDESSDKKDDSKTSEKAEKKEDTSSAK